MSKIATCIVTWFLALFTGVSFAQFNCTMIGGEKTDIAYAVLSTPDSGYIIGGRTSSYGDSLQADMYLIKVNKYNEIEWSKVIGGPGGEDIINDIILTPDNGFIIVGEIGFRARDIFVAKLDNMGNILWYKIIGSTADEAAKGVTMDIYGDIVIVGTTTTYFGTREADITVLKLSQQGDIIWSIVVGGTAGDTGEDIIWTPDGGVIVVGRTYSYGQGGGDMYIVKLGYDGTPLWDIAIGGSNTEIANSIVQLTDSHFIVSGQTSTYGGGGWDMYIAKITNNGSVLWVKTVGLYSNEIAHSVTISPKGTILSCGTTMSIGQGLSDSYIIELDTAGNLLRTLSIGTEGDDYCFAATTDFNGDIIIVGRVATSWNLGGSDIYFVRLDSSWRLHCSDVCLADAGGIEGSGFVIDSGVTVLNAVFSDTVLPLNQTVGYKTLNKPPFIIISVDNITDASCNSCNDGAIDITVFGGIPPYRYIWSNGSQTEDLTNIYPGIYSLTVLDSAWCTAMKDSIRVYAVNDVEDIASLSPCSIRSFNQSILLTCDVPATIGIYGVNGAVLWQGTIFSEKQIKIPSAPHIIMINNRAYLINMFD